MLKVTVVGGGSTYTPELFNGFLKRQETFPLDELWLYDIDSERLGVVGDFIQRIADKEKAKFKIVLTTDRKAAIQNSSYVITQLRVGKMKARKEDEYLGKRHGLIGQETTGVGGMAKALRTIPVVIDIAKEIKELAPDAMLVNFANPAGLVTEALFRFMPSVQSVGVCNVAITIKMEILNQLNQSFDMQIQPDEAEIKCLGLNHLTWFYGFEVNGVDYWPQVMSAVIQEAGKDQELRFDVNTLRNLNMLPNDYLRYFYYKQKLIEQQKNWPPSRAEVVHEIETNLLKEYSDPTQNTFPKDMMKRGGAYYSTVATQLLNSHFNDIKQTQVVNIRHGGAIEGWDPDWVVEMPCSVSAKGIEPIPTQPLPPVCAGLVAQVKAYEILTAEAALTGERRLAYQALLVHPLGPPADKVEAVLEDLLKTNRGYLPNFFK